MRATMDGVDKKLEAMAARVRKHLGHGPVFGTVWSALKQELLARCARVRVGVFARARANDLCSRLSSNCGQTHTHHTLTRVSQV
jgi:hypothetical protein